MKPFQPFNMSAGQKISVTTSSAATALKLPQGDFVRAVARVYNAGDKPVAINFGDDTVVAADGTNLMLAPGRTEGIDLSAKNTHIAAIGIGGASTLYIIAGEGIVSS